jgi:hypothetical protein
MSIFNKVVVVLLLLVAMILVPLILIFPEQAESALRYAADVIQANLEWLNSLSSTAQIGIRLLLAFVGVIVFLIGLIFLMLEVLRIRRKTVRLKDKSGEVMVDSITGHLTYHLDLLPDVLRVRPQVVSRGKKVSVTIYVETPPEVNVPEKSAEVQETARRVIEDQLGLETRGDIKVLIRPIAYPKISPVEQARPTRTEPPATPPLAPVEPVIEDQEMEPLFPQQEERPVVEQEVVAPPSPFESVPDESRETRPLSPNAEQIDSDQGDATTLDVKEPTSPSLR